MKDIKPDFSRFGTRFQESLVSLIIKDRPFSDQIKEVLDINYLEVKQLQFVLKEIYDYKQKYKIHPSTDALLVLLNEKKREHETIPAYEKAIEFVTSVAETKDIPDENFIKETALNFCKKQALADAIFKSVDLLDKSSYDEIQKLINDAMKLGVSQDSGHDFHKDFEARYLSSSRKYIETPWPEINDITQGGFGRGELHLIISNTGGGKSHAMINFGAHAIKQGYNGVHYTLELKDIATTRRYDSCISGIDINVANQNKHFIKEAVEECPGELIVREWPTKSASVNTIRAHLDKIIGNGFKPDFVIVDYADLLKSISKSSEKRHQLEEVNEELRGIAQAYNVVCLSASQSNRCVQVSEIVELSTGKVEIGKVKLGDKILTHLGFKEITYVFEKQTQPVYEIVTKSGKKVKVSANHLIPLTNGELKNICNGLKVGDKISVKQ